MSIYNVQNYALIRQQLPGSHCLFIQQRRNYFQSDWLRALTFQYFIFLKMKVFQIAQVSAEKTRALFELAILAYKPLVTLRDSETVKNLLRTGIFFFRKLTF